MRNNMILGALGLAALATIGVGQFRDEAAGIFPRGERIVSDNFRGVAYLQVLVEGDSVNPSAVGNVTFEPGARTRWHRHPGGQILLVTEGVGYYQEEGQARKVLRKGDVVKCPANIAHWHGASADSGFVQVAITNRHLGAVVWLEHVDDSVYHALSKP